MTHLGSDLKNPMEELEINEEKYREIELKLISEPPAPNTFVFLGEGSFTFSTAFAARCGSWQGLVPTTYYKLDELKPWEETMVVNGQCNSEDQLQQYSTSWSDTVKVMLEVIEWKEGNRDAKTLLQKWVDEKSFPIRRHLDATCMGDREGLKARLGIPENSDITLWFQCPWAMDCKQDEFLKNVFDNAALIQKKGEFLLLGICTDPSKGQIDPVSNKFVTFVSRYGRLQENSKEIYECIGADKCFVGEMLQRGYKHRIADGSKGLGLRESWQFATILFKRNGKPTTGEQEKLVEEMKKLGH